MPTNPSPSRPNLEFYRKQAKALLKSARNGDAEALARFGRAAAHLQSALPQTIALHDAQLVIARENAFDSWPKFRAHIESERPAGAVRFRPHVRGFQWYEERVAGMVSVHHAGLAESLETIRRHHPRFTSATDEQIRTAPFTEEDARLVLAREHGFSTWADFKSHVDAIAAGTQPEPFTAAFDAIQAGNSATLSTLLAAHPDLPHAQGTNGSSLLNLAVSLRQPALCQLLLDAGADPDLPTTRGVTPLHAAGYSNQPVIAQLLLDAGASPQASAYGDGGTPLVMALFWGHKEVRHTLAAAGIFPPNLRAAAGTGQLDLLAQCFTAAGHLTEPAVAHRAFYRPHTSFPLWTPSNDPQEILDEALTYAVRNAQLAAADFLLGRGANINGDPYRGTPLLWATHKNLPQVTAWLLDRGADINLPATFGGPRHGNGIVPLHLAAEGGNLPLVQLLLERGGNPNIKDALYKATPLGWAEFLKQPAAAERLRAATSG